MTIVHLTARLRPAFRCLTDDEHAAWFWARMRQRFPDALGATLMPNHPHLVTPVEDVGEAYSSFVHLLGAFARRVVEDPLRVRGRAPRVWEPAPPPEIIEGRDKVARQLRYLDLNAPRARLTNDVLKWQWSTHLDVVGAIDDPWVTLDRVRLFVPPRLARNVKTWHGYVSGDPSTKVAGTPLAEPVTASAIARYPLGDLLEAAAWATRSSTRAIALRSSTRSTFIWLAREQGWARSGQIAELCGVTPRSVQRALAGPSPSALAPARLCLRIVAERDVRRVADFCEGPNVAFGDVAV